MPYNGSGTFSLTYNWATEQASSPIEIAKLDTQESDIASGLSNCILRDGTGLPSTTIPWNSQALTGVSNLSAERLTVTGTTVPANGLYLPSASTVGFSANTTAVGSLTTSVMTMPAFAVTGATVPANGMYLSAANTVAFASNTTLRGSVNSTGNWTFVAPSSGVHTINGAVQIGTGAGVPAATGGGVFFDYASSISRMYIGDGTGYSWRISKRVGSVTTDLLTYTDSGNVTINAPSSGTALTVSGGGASITGTVTATTFSGSGASLTSIPNSAITGLAASATTDTTSASNISSGTLPSGRLSGSYTGITAIGNATVQDSAGTSISIGYRGIPQNSQSANYTCVLADAGKHILHPSGGGAGDTFTIPSNASVAYDIGTTLTFVNADSNSVSIAITTDTMTLAGTTTTGTRTLAQNGVATAIKVASTSWIISGSGLS